MKNDHIEALSMIRIYIRGALSLYEDEGSEIFHILRQQQNRSSARVFDGIGAALFCANDALEEILNAQQDAGKD